MTLSKRIIHATHRLTMSDHLPLVGWAHEAEVLERKVEYLKSQRKLWETFADRLRLHMQTVTAEMDLLDSPK